MNELKYKTQITLYDSYFDMNDNISLKSVLSIFQDVAAAHAEQIGLGFEETYKKNLYWVLSRIKFDILRMPTRNETVIVETWPHEKGRIDFDRDMKISSKSGEILIIGSSKWCVINTQTRMLERTDNITYNGTICPDVNYSERFGKIILPNQTPTQKFTHLVRFSDIDHNQHMNNTNYANLVACAIENKVVKHFEINYIKECKLDDIIEVSTIKTESSEYIVGTVNQNTTVFTALTK